MPKNNYHRKLFAEKLSHYPGSQFLATSRRTFIIKNYAVSFPIIKINFFATHLTQKRTSTYVIIVNVDVQKLISLIFTYYMLL